MDAAEFKRRCETLRADRAHGASVLARQALEILQQSAATLDGVAVQEFCTTMQERCTALARVRPSMAVVATQVERWRNELERVCTDGKDVGRVRRDMAAYAAQMIQASLLACDAAAEHMASVVKPRQTIITLSSSSTLNATFARLAQNVRFIIAESRPLNEGVAVAQHLLERGFDVTLITEAQLGLFVERADIALIGADTVLADGSVVNKAGSYLLALVAKAAGVPLYACHESFKECPLEWDEFEIEAMDVAELGHPEIPAAAQRNLYFDRTPPHLIHARVTEHGVV
jgi:translation initiation factor 2B subunit (eIF-2B alpha/beta/delta family)